ncbi:lipoprotein [Sulfurifustis variabilis]|uniref:Lipoprotein n=1 Tax=Sulfurifustis variabilis TaxID=1675686 RepID=A0A1B4V7G0_9GAMM|nr:DUF2846 domain-containing protein [Sulfurifustis variabilis]BAU49473.1 lipoprotein [Sulfurifustis variabilis]
MYKSLSRLALAGAFLLLGACASVPMATESEDMQAKQASVPAGKSLIYLYRNETFGAAVKLNVTLDGRDAGETASKTYFMWTVNPGQHQIVSKGENNASLTVDAKPGQRYYVWQEVKMGMFQPRSLLHVVDEPTGREGVKECKLIKGNI